MKYTNPGCSRGIGLVASGRGWFSKRRYCSKRCRNALVVDAANLQQNPMLKRFMIACVAFVGLTASATFTMAAVLAAPSDLPGCDHSLAEASAGITTMQARIKSLGGADRLEICAATRLYFFEVVKARAVTALCKSGAERERDLGRFDADVARANDAIAARCL